MDRNSRSRAMFRLQKANAPSGVNDSLPDTLISPICSLRPAQLFRQKYSILDELTKVLPCKVASVSGELRAGQRLHLRRNRRRQCRAREPKHAPALARHQLSGSPTSSLLPSLSPCMPSLPPLLLSTCVRTSFQPAQSLFCPIVILSLAYSHSPFICSFFMRALGQSPPVILEIAQRADLCAYFL